MIVKLPAIKRDNNGQVTRYEVKFTLDTSAYSEYRFKRYFKDEVEYKSLAEFAPSSNKRTKHRPNRNIMVLYCFLKVIKYRLLKTF